VALGALILVQTLGLSAAATYARVSPRLFPFAIGGGLVVIGAGIVLRTLPAWRRWARGAVPHEHNELGAMAMALAGLALHQLLVERLGFVIAGAILFTCVAASFGSRRYLRDALCGLGLTLIVYIALGVGLDLQLPAGILAGLF
jgi:putative tricarboxylic transport membrane protein